MSWLTLVTRVAGQSIVMAGGQRGRWRGRRGKRRRSGRPAAASPHSAPRQQGGQWSLVVTGARNEPSAMFLQSRKRPLLGPSPGSLHPPGVRFSVKRATRGWPRSMIWGVFRRMPMATWNKILVIPVLATTLTLCVLLSSPGSGQTPRCRWGRSTGRRRRWGRWTAGRR